jgi:hypothetical protein
MDKVMLKLCEQMMLLGLNDESGALVFTIKTQFPFAISASLMFDLYYKGIISIKDEAIILNNKDQNTEEYLKYSANLLSQTDKTHDITSAMQKLTAGYDEISRLITDSLVIKNILKKESHKLLWVFNYERFPTNDPTPERELRSNLKSIILEDKIPSNRDLILIGLISASDLTNEIFSYDEREIASDRISVLADEDFIEQFISINETILIRTVTSIIRKSYSSTLRQTGR